MWGLFLEIYVKIDITVHAYPEKTPYRSHDLLKHYVQSLPLHHVSTFDNFQVIDIKNHK